MALPLAQLDLIPLVANLPLPSAAPARTRPTVPSGYGVEEQCLPFIAAAALGLMIPSPITFGHCPPAEVPAGSRAFRGPLRLGEPRIDWLFYVQDDATCSFAGNAYRIQHPASDAPGVEAGISFFDRQDQHDLFKVHLPYIWRTAANVDTLFTAPINRRAKGFDLVAGLVETDWYASPINLVLRAGATPIHVARGSEIAQATLIAREQRHPELRILPPHARSTREAFNALGEWQKQHARDRSAYKLLARGRQTQAGT
jgi:hypothetical protein